MKANENCLAGLRCPRCGSLGPFTISATSWFKVYDDDGTDSYGDVEWNSDSPAMCWECSFAGRVKDFKLTNKWRIDYERKRRQAKGK